MEPQSGRESDDPMYLHIAGPRPEGVQRAKELCDELLQKVRVDYQSFKENAAQGRFGGGGDRYSNGRPGYGERDRSQSYGHGGYGGQHDHQQSPGGAADANNSAADYNAQWAAWYAQQQQQQQPGQDPYAAYGGYEGYVAWYNYYAQQGQAGTQQSPPPGTAAAPPPPPSDPAPPGAAPPPPPPSGSPPGTYSAVRSRFSYNYAKLTLG